MQGATRRWQPCAEVALAIHQFPKGVVIFNAENRVTCYLPQLAAQVFSILLRTPSGLEEVEIIDSLVTGPGASDAQPDVVDGDTLQSILAALEQQHLISTCE